MLLNTYFAFSFACGFFWVIKFIQFSRVEPYLQREDFKSLAIIYFIVFWIVFLISPVSFIAAIFCKIK